MENLSSDWFYKLLNWNLGKIGKQAVVFDCLLGLVIVMLSLSGYQQSLLALYILVVTICV